MPGQKARRMVSDGPTIRELRDQQVVSVKDLAAALDVWPNSVYMWERGDTVPPLREAILIAKHFGLPVEEINWWPEHE